MLGIGGKIKQRPEDFIVEEIPEKARKITNEHVIFWVEKINLDTQDVVRILSKKLHVSKKRFGYAGTKDKFAVVRQRFSLWDPDGNLEEKLKSLKFKKLKIYGFERGERLSLGELKGNKFLITIRDVELSEEEIKKRLEKIFEELKKGIPNFFGEQRFGKIRPVTHLVGLKMLKGEFEKACKFYIALPFGKEKEEIKNIRREIWENWGKRKIYLKALERFPKKFRYERTMLDYLYRYPNDFVGALRRIPKRVRKLFINAVQSLIFNEVLKKLVKEKCIEWLKDKELPLVGYDTVLEENNEIHREIKNFMKKLGIKQKDFLVKSMPEMKTSGSERKAILEVKDIKLEEISEDELNLGKKAVKVSFSLPPGSYATVVIDKIINGC